MRDIDKVMTPIEAAERWNMSRYTIAQACSGYKKAPPRFKEGEFRKSGNAWLITYKGMVRLFGEEPKQKKTSL